MKSFNRLFIVWIIVVVLIFGGLITVGFIYKGKVNEYHKFENDIVKLTERYISDKNIIPKDNETVKINIKDLVKDGYLSKEDIIDGCTGNVIVNKKRNITYKPTIECKYYKSEK